jgi:2'-5' RNA ligase
MEQIRSFVAIELTDQLKAQLTSVQESLKGEAAVDRVRWVKPEGIHLTLQFLGDVPADRVKEISVAVADGCWSVHPFDLAFAGLGCFPSASRPNVLWVGVEGDTDILAGLQGSIQARLARLGYPPEKRKYTPHLTLGRVARHTGDGDRRKLGTLVRTYSMEPLGGMEVRQVCLMRSQLSPAGARYSRLAVAHLEAE